MNNINIIIILMYKLLLKIKKIINLLFFLESIKSYGNIITAISK